MKWRASPRVFSFRSKRTRLRKIGKKRQQRRKLAPRNDLAIERLYDYRLKPVTAPGHSRKPVSRTSRPGTLRTCATFPSRVKRAEKTVGLDPAVRLTHFNGTRQHPEIGRLRSAAPSLARNS